MYLHEEIKALVTEIRAHRAGMPICPSAQLRVDVGAILTIFCDEGFYQEDYQAITSYFTVDYVSYEDVVENIRNIVYNGLFKEQ